MSQTRSWWSLEHSHVVSSTPRNLFFQFNIKKSPNLNFIVFSTFKSTNPSYFEKMRIRLGWCMVLFSSEIVHFTKWNILLKHCWNVSEKMSVFAGKSRREMGRFSFLPNLHNGQERVKNWFDFTYFFFDEKMKKFKICLWLDHTKTWDDRVFFPTLFWIIPGYCKL